MGNRRANKDCIELRICIDNITEAEVIRYQANRVEKEGVHYKKGEAAADLFMDLVRKSKGK